MAARRLVTILFFLSCPIVWASDARSLLELIAELAWIGVLLHTNRHSSMSPFIAMGTVLGLGAYTHAGAIVTMPLLMMTGAAIMLARGDAQVLDRRIGVMMLAFLVILAPLMLRLIRGDFDRLVIAHGLYDASRFNPLQGAREIFSWVGLVARSDVYFRSFDPALLFLAGGTLRHAIASPVMFVAPFAVLVPLGIYAAAISRTPERWIFWAALVVPVAAALTAQPPIASRLLLLAPFATLLAVDGFAYLFASQRRGWQFAGAITAGAVPLFALLALHY